MDEKILVIFTGGTIGSSVKNGIIAPDESMNKELIQSYERDYADNISFDLLSPFSLLSENVTPTELGRLSRLVEENREKGYRGIIITYGSDTLSFATAFMSLAFKGELKCPLVFVAGNKLLSDPESNGFLNFAGAVGLIKYLSKSGMYNDVYAVWNSGNAFCAYRGAELSEADAGSHNHGVFGKEPFAEFYPEGLNATGEGYTWRVVINDRHENRCEPDIDFELLAKLRENDFKINQDIAAVRIYPGIDFDRINTDGLKAILLYGYHSGTFPDTANSNFGAFVKKAAANGIRVYAASFKPEETAVYESMKNAGDEIIRLEDLSFETAYAYTLIKESV